MNQEIIRAKSIIAELKLNNETAHRLHGYDREFAHGTENFVGTDSSYKPTLQAQSSDWRKFNNAVFAVNMIDEEPPKPPPDEDESKPPVKSRRQKTRQSRNHHQKIVKFVLPGHSS